jgi:hypothetical protein
MPKHLGIDVDSTLYPMDEITLPFIATRFGIKAAAADIDSWSWYTRGIGLTNEDFGEVMRHTHAPEQIMRARPYPGAVKALRAWARAGHVIHVVSHRHPETAAATLDWLRHIQVPVDEYVFSMDTDKLAYAREHDLVGFIDDRPDFLLELVAEGLGAATLRHPYNATVLEAEPRIIAADSWAELAPRVTLAFGL